MAGRRRVTTLLRALAAALLLAAWCRPPAPPDSGVSTMQGRIEAAELDAEARRWIREHAG